MFSSPSLLRSLLLSLFLCLSTAKRRMHETSLSSISLFLFFLSLYNQEECTPTPLSFSLLSLSLSLSLFLCLSENKIEECTRNISFSSLFSLYFSVSLKRSLPLSFSLYTFFPVSPKPSHMFMMSLLGHTIES